MNGSEITSLNIPNWFVRFTASVIALAVPWAVWVTIQLATIGVRIEATNDLRNHLDSLTAKFAVHLTDPEIHHAGIRDTLRRLDRFDSKLEQLHHHNK